MTISLHHSPPISLPQINSSVFLQKAKRVNPNPANPFPVLWETAQKLAVYLRSIERELQQVTQGNRPWTVIEDCPIDDDLPPTPTDGKHPSEKGWVSEQMLLAALYTAKLQPLTFLQEKKGQMIHQIAPVPGFSHTQSNAGRVPFSWHADDGHLLRDFRPEFLLLLGLRNPGETKTFIVDVGDVMKRLQRRFPQFAEVLRQPRYRMMSPDSFDYNGHRILTKLQPFISTNLEGKDEVAGNLSNIQTFDEEAKAALETLTSFLKPPITKSVILRPGTLLIFNNFRCLHARDAVFSDRWLQRVYARTSLDALRTATNSDGFVFDSRLIALS